MHSQPEPLLRGRVSVGRGLGATAEGLKVPADSDFGPAISGAHQEQ